MRNSVLRSLCSAIIPAIIALSSASCKSECIIGNKQQCQDATSTDPGYVLQISLKIPKTEFDIAEGINVRVTVLNVSTVDITIPDQRCSRPFYVDDLSNQSMADPSIICDNDSYPGKKLVPGDSIVWQNDIRSEIRNFGKDLPTGEYYVYGRVSVFGRLLYTQPRTRVTILGK